MKGTFLLFFILLIGLVQCQRFKGPKRPKGPKGKGPFPSSSSPGTTTVTENSTSSGVGSTTTDSYCDEVINSNSPSPVSSNSNCGDDAVGYFELCEANGFRYVITSGAPKHQAEFGQQHANPNKRCERWQYAKLPLQWVDSGTVTESMGTTGFVFSGGVLYDHRSGPQDDAPLAVYYEGPTLDPYNGHSDQHKQYHYHAVPKGWSEAADPKACEHIGYMRDGGKVYGLCEVDGVELTSCYHAVDPNAEATNESDYYYEKTNDCHLDKCNMFEYEGEMVYFLSSSHPFVPPCMKGYVVHPNGFTPSSRPE